MGVVSPLFDQVRTVKNNIDPLPTWFTTSSVGAHAWSVNRLAQAVNSRNVMHINTCSQLNRALSWKRTTFLASYFYRNNKHSSRRHCTFLVYGQWTVTKVCATAAARRAVVRVFRIGHTCVGFLIKLCHRILLVRYHSPHVRVQIGLVQKYLGMTPTSFQPIPSTWRLVSFRFLPTYTQLL